MASFTEFRNSFPESNNEKGERFEIFLSEWMFKHHPVLSSQFKKVWRFSEWPEAWSQKDLGTDLIAEDQHGKICAIQAKFYKEKNSIPKSHIDSFLSDSNRPEVDYRYLIATTDNLGANAIKTIEGQEKPVHTFMLQQFNEEFEWPKSIDSLESHQPRKPHQPRPHQKAAIDDVCAKLGKRGQLLMACGTGKTLTGQRIAESLGSNTTLVLLPSLLLLSKTVADWVGEKERDFIYLPVCSDKSVTKKTDEITLGSHELPFQSTTDSSEIAAFLRRSENKVIFSTYQSSPQIAEAFRAESLKPFELIIADEAHRCAGRVSSDYSTVLSEDLIPAQKRLFMTATPRTYSSRLQKSAMDAEIQVASMDDEEVFGPVLHHLTFGQAIENDPPLLTDYRVVVVGVNDALVREQVEERAFVKTEGGLEDDARSLAIQIGLSKAIKDYDLKRVISFHGRVKYASDFASSFISLQEDLKSGSKPTGVTTYGYVSGAMPTSQRTRELRALGELANEDRYIVGNARCLSEGVDVPALDGVAFVDPKRSEIDIVQAVGRAIRLAECKSFGTIVIPVFISDEDDPDEALSNSEFDQVWKVVNALRSHDEALGETLDELRVGLGRQSKISLSGTKIIFDCPTGVDNRFIEAFQTRLVETTTSSWEFWYGLLEKYKDAHGDCSVPDKSLFEGMKLGQWVGTQRYLKDKLSPVRVGKLDSLGFVWDPHAERWEAGFKYLRQFFDEKGHCRVKVKEIYRGFALGSWVSHQRWNKQTLGQDRLTRLEQLPFSWDPEDEVWEERYAQLLVFKEQNGHSLVPYNYPKNPELGRWTNKVRSKKDKLRSDRIKKLDSIGFVWKVSQDETWESAFSTLEKYLKDGEHRNIPKSAKYADPVTGKQFLLHGWIKRQRTNKSQLSKSRIAKLDSVGFDWDPYASDWEEGFSKLTEYLAEKGTTRVPATHSYQGYKLGMWVRVQRRERDNMLDERRARLDNMQFSWDPFLEDWEEGFNALAAYKALNGHLDVPKDYQYNGKNLHQWISRQRQRKAKLDVKLVERLLGLGLAI